MFLSKRSNGIYYLWYEDELGERHKVSTQTKLKSEALKFYQGFKRDTNQTTKSSKKKSLSVFIGEYLIFAQGNYSAGTVGIYKGALNRFLLIVGNRPLSALTPLHADQHRIERLKSISPVSVNIELRTLKAAFNHACRWMMMEKNPFKGVKLARSDEKAPTYFTKEEFQKLASVVKEKWFKDLIVFAVLTGLRRGEIVNLRWSDVDLARKVIQIQSSPTFRTKQGMRRTVPLNNVAFQLLQTKHGGIRSVFVFSSKSERILECTLSHKFNKNIKLAGLGEKGLHFHSLRHTFASWLVQDGVSLYEVQKLLGHTSTTITQIYSHLQPEALHATVNRILLQN